MNDQNKKQGIVVNCLWANAYEHPDILSNSLYAFSMLERVEVIPENSTDSKFYCVSIPKNVTGYCLKKYIVLCE